MTRLDEQEDPGDRSNPIVIERMNHQATAKQRALCTGQLKDTATLLLAKSLFSSRDNLSHRHRSSYLSLTIIPYWLSCSDLNVF